MTFPMYRLEFGFGERKNKKTLSRINSEDPLNFRLYHDVCLSGRWKSRVNQDRKKDDENYVLCYNVAEM